MKISITIISLFLTSVIFNYIHTSMITGLVLSTIVYIVIYYLLKNWLEL